MPYMNQLTDFQRNSSNWFLCDMAFHLKVFLNKLKKAVKEVDIFKIVWQLYFVKNIA